jgi:predicted nuclease of predicted toxin-antitoxin system
MTDDKQSIIPAVAEAAANPLNVLLALFTKLKEHTEQAEELDAKAAIHHKRIKELSERDIPDMMADLGLKEFTMRDGTKVVVKDDVFASVSRERMPQVVAWLRANNMAGIAKEEILVDQTPAMKEQLTLKEVPFVIEHTIHASTLKAFAKERILAESDPACTIKFPRELFAVSVVPKASLVRGRQ